MLSAMPHVTPKLIQHPAISLKQATTKIRLFKAFYSEQSFQKLYIYAIEKILPPNQFPRSALQNKPQILANSIYKPLSYIPSKSPT